MFITLGLPVYNFQNWLCHFIKHFNRHVEARDIYAMVNCLT